MSLKNVNNNKRDITIRKWRKCCNVEKFDLNSWFHAVAMNFASTKFLRLKILTASSRCKYIPTKEFHISACGQKSKKFTTDYCFNKPCEKVKTNLEHATTGIKEICTGPANNSFVSTVFKLSDCENKYVNCLTEAHFKPMKHIR